MARSMTMAMITDNGNDDTDNDKGKRQKTKTTCKRINSSTHDTPAIPPPMTTYEYYGLG